jgi:hypothetical protein|tara:strand:- start:10241 stop:11113 length:873 start_codon:yes stop_codon:yes gene_type:complete
MMSGPRFAKNYVSNYLGNDLPSRLITYRNHWGLSSTQLPDPRYYLSYEPFALDAWPTVINLVINTRSVTREGYEFDHDPNFRVVYEMRTYIWVRDQGAETVTAQRDNLTTVIREALMDGPSLSEYDTSVPCSPKIDEGTIREEFSDLTLIKGERLLAGAYIAYDLALEEIIDHTPVGVFTSADVTVTSLPITAIAPTNLLGIPGDTQVTLSWKESTWNGGVHEISGYTVQQSIDAGSTWTTVTADTGSTDGFYVVTGLGNGVSYSFRVAANNTAGVGAYSAASTAVSPVA